MFILQSDHRDILILTLKCPTIPTLSLKSHTNALKETQMLSANFPLALDPPIHPTAQRMSKLGVLDCGLKIPQKLHAQTSKMNNQIVLKHEGRGVLYFSLYYNTPCFIV